MIMACSVSSCLNLFLTCTNREGSGSFHWLASLTYNKVLLLSLGAELRVVTGSICIVTQGSVRAGVKYLCLATRSRGSSVED